jgi:hypothetical protein
MPQEWYLFQKDRELGPYSWEELLSFAETGVMQPEDLVWAEGLDDWTEAGQVEGLFPEILPAAYDQAEMVPLEGSMPVPVPPSLEAVPASKSPLPIILVGLAVLLLAGGALAFVLNLQGSETADETGWFEPADDYFFADDEVMATAQSVSPTGPSMFSMGPGVVPAAFSRTTPKDHLPDGPHQPGQPGEPSEPGTPSDPASPLHSVHNVVIDRQSPAVLQSGTPISYGFSYSTNHPGNVRIVGQPLWSGNPLLNVSLNPPVDFPTGQGSGRGYFIVRSTQPVNQFRIRMYASATNTVLHERIFNVNYTFTPAPGPSTTTPPPDQDPPPVSGYPVARFGYSPARPVAGEIVTFNAAGSYSPNGSITNYRWDWGNNTFTNTGNPIIGKRFTHPGHYVVRLTVTDNLNRRHTASRLITVRFPSGEEPPDEVDPPDPDPEQLVASFIISPAAPLEGQSITFDASGSASPSGDIVSYSWVFNGGNPIVENIPLYQTSSLQGGDHTVTLTVRDSEGNEASAERQFTVRSILVPDPVPLVAAFTFSPTQPDPGQPVNFDASGSSSPHGDIISYYWQFGDGFSIEGGQYIQVAHNYREAGRYTVTLTILDAMGNTETATDQIPVFVTATPPPGQDSLRACFTMPENIETLTHPLFDASCSVSLNSTITRYKWKVTKPDGRFYENEYNTPYYRPFITLLLGEHTMKLTIYDEQNRAATHSKTFTVLR